MWTIEDVIFVITGLFKKKFLRVEHFAKNPLLKDKLLYLK